MKPKKKMNHFNNKVMRYLDLSKAESIYTDKGNINDLPNIKVFFMDSGSPHKKEFETVEAMEAWLKMNLPVNFTEF
jgi:hypothetical protein